MICAPDFQGVAARALGLGRTLDFSTGIPYPAAVPDSDTISHLNDRSNAIYYDFPLRMTRWQLANLWYNARKLRIDAPTGTAFVSVDRIFQDTDVPTGWTRTSINALPPVRESFCYPLTYDIEQIDEGSGTNMGIILIIGQALVSALLSDGKNKFYTVTEFTDVKAGPAPGGGPDIDWFYNLQNFDGTHEKRGTFKLLGAKCDIFGDPDSPSYGDVTVTIDDDWS